MQSYLFSSEQTQLCFPGSVLFCTAKKNLPCPVINNLMNLKGPLLCEQSLIKQLEAKIGPPVHSSIDF